MNLKEQLRTYQRKVKAWEGHSHDRRYNKEQNTLVKFVVPLLELLGWDPQSTDVGFEYAIQDLQERRGKRVDCALYLPDEPKPRILVEVKPFQNEEVGASRQLFKYLTVAEVIYGITTNGRTVVIYDRRFVPHSYKRARRLFTIHADDFVKHRWVLMVLSKKAVQDGLLEKLAKRFRRPFFSWCKKAGIPYDSYGGRLLFAEQELRKLRK